MFQMIDKSKHRAEGETRETFRTQIRPVPTPRKTQTQAQAEVRRTSLFWRIIAGLFIATSTVVLANCVYSTILFYFGPW